MTPIIIHCHYIENPNQIVSNFFPGIAISSVTTVENKLISIDSIKILQNKLSLLNSRPELEIHLIYPADLLSIPAQNSLLKCLEECPTEKLIIMLTTNPHQLLPTITSRCQLKKYSNYATAEKIPIDKYVLPKTYSDAISLTELIQKTSNPDELIQGLVKNSIPEEGFRKKIILLNLQHLLNDLQSNVNKKLALDTFFFHIVESLYAA